MVFAAFLVAADYAAPALEGAVCAVESFALRELGFDLFDLLVCHGCCLLVFW